MTYLVAWIVLGLSVYAIVVLGRAIRRELTGKNRYASKAQSNALLYALAIVCCLVGVLVAALVLLGAHGVLPSAQVALFTVYSNTEFGIYGKDADGTPWCMFRTLGYCVRCAACSKEINHGWQRGRMGEETSYCSEHIEYIGKQEGGAAC